MSMSFTRLATFILFACCVLMPLGVSAQMPQQQVPPPVSLDVPLVNQNASEWCWLAASEMVMDYRNTTAPSQCRMMEIANNVPAGTCCNNPVACNAPARSMAAVMAVIGNIGGVTSSYARPTDPLTLYRTLQNDDPVIMQVAMGGGGSHAVVLRGMRFQVMMGRMPNGMPVQQIVPVLVINDPMQQQPVEVAYQAIVGQWMDALVVGKSFRAFANAAPSASRTTTAPAPQASSSSSFCQAARRVAAAAPGYSSLNGTQDPDDEESYSMLGSFPGTMSCDVDHSRDDDGSVISDYVYCRVLHNASCSSARGRYMALVSQIASCYPAVTPSTDDDATSDDRLTTFALPSGNEIWVSEDPKNGTCNLSLRFE